MFPVERVVVAVTLIDANDAPGAGMVPLNTQLTTCFDERSEQVHPVPVAADAVTPVARAIVTVGSRVSVPPEADNDGVIE